MDKKSTGPYKHYERPTEKRSAKDHRPNGSGRWIATIVILAVILIALVPIVYRLASNHSSEKATEVQTVKKTSLSSKSKSSQAKKNPQLPQLLQRAMILPKLVLVHRKRLFIQLKPVIL